MAEIVEKLAICSRDTLLKRMVKPRPMKLNHAAA
jgi:hypothetical protein